MGSQGILQAILLLGCGQNQGEGLEALVPCLSLVPKRSLALLLLESGPGISASPAREWSY